MKASQSCSALCDPWTVACQPTPSMEFPSQKQLSALPCPSPGDLPNPGTEARSPTLQAESLTFEPPGKPKDFLTLDQNWNMQTSFPSCLLHEHLCVSSGNKQYSERLFLLQKDNASDFIQALLFCKRYPKEMTTSYWKQDKSLYQKLCDYSHLCFWTT